MIERKVFSKFFQPHYLYISLKLLLKSCEWHGIILIDYSDFSWMFNSLFKWPAHWKRFIFVSIISQLAHNGNQSCCCWCKEQWFLQNWSWTLSKTSGHCQRGPAGPFETSAIMLFSWQVDNFIREVSQRESLNPSCAYEEQMHLKICWRA